MTMPQQITVTRDELASALASWEKESKAKNWPDRTDPERHLDNADYLIGLIQAGQTEGVN
jgi:hypothetical protein